ncbi:hypothetical protein BCV72DRAFT_216621, partial [Rhizopus microsporus var. microsporus]
FPKISFATLSLPRKHDGVGALDPHVQQMTLQWRWLLSLLANRFHTTQSLRCLPYLERIPAGISGYPSSHLWPVLFPSL